MLLTEILAFAGLGATIIAMFGILIYFIISQSKQAERNKVIAELENNAAKKLREANEIVATRSDPDDLERSLRDGSF